MFEVRDLSSSIRAVVGKAAAWSKWSTRKAVTDGYAASGWVYRAIKLIADNGCTVPFKVFNTTTGEFVDQHPLNELLRNPSPGWSRSEFYWLLLAWSQLSGRALIYQNKVGQETKELWPISPDRLAPIRSDDPVEMIDGYELVRKDGTKARSDKYTNDNIIYFRLMDPADPINGIGPLQAAARQVDIDVFQLEWNGSAMDNRGVVDGVFTFKDNIPDRTTFNAIVERITELWTGRKNARKPMVVGNGATYQRLSLTPAEMDFLTSRIKNREEIFIIFGIPPQLAGAQEFSTYNNFSTSMRIFWEITLGPLLNSLTGALTTGLKEHLQEGLIIAPDFSAVSALRGSMDEKAKTATRLWKMGVPFVEINRRLEMGIEEFAQWDEPFGGKSPDAANSVSVEEETVRSAWRLRETRSIAEEMSQRDQLADGVVADAVGELLTEQRGVVLAAIESGGDVQTAVSSTRDRWMEVTTRQATSVALQLAGAVVVDQRGRTPFETRDLDATIAARIAEAFAADEWLLTDAADIERTTAELVVEQVTHGNAEGWNVEQIRQAIDDVGVFGPERALRIARTLSSTATSIGQLVAADAAGAATKTWWTGGGNVRDAHSARSGETVALGERFSLRIGAVAPRYPGDPQVDPADRVNCRCAMTFE